MTRTIGFLTSDEVGLAEDDRRLVAPLERRGFKIVPLVWDAAPPAEPPAAIVVRSCWDYHRKQAAFKRWLAAAEQGPVPVWNPPAVLRWNLDKHYLRDLAARGVAIPRTVFVPQGAATSLAALLDEHGLAEVVVKPAVSLSAYRTWRSDPGQAGAHQAEFAALLADGAALVQGFVPEVLTAGELSLVFVEREFSHAVRKRPRAGDFRVQMDHGGTREPYTPPAWMITRAAACLDAVPGPLLYARVDGFEVDGELVLMELELLDPVLFFGVEPAAAERMAAAIAARLG